MIVALLLAGLLTISLFANLGLLLSNSLPDLGAGGGGGGAGMRRMPLEEMVVEPSSGRDKIAQIDVTGMIANMQLDASGLTMVKYIENQFERAGTDDAVKAVLLKVDSPGGEVMASDDIYKIIKEFQEEYDKPVVASMGNLAASGGYYVSAPCAWIVANELTMTGSIGVIMQTYNLRRLMDRYGVVPMTFKSGKHKDMLSMSKKPEEIDNEERKIVEDFINTTFTRFKDVIRTGRETALEINEGAGRELVEDWEKYADGRILDGTKAYELGLVDELGGIDVAIARAEQLAGIENARIVRYNRPFNLGSLFGILGKAPSSETTVKLDLGIRLPELKVGQPYYLPSMYAE